MDPSALPAMFAGIENKVSDSGGIVALVMAHEFERAVKKNLSLLTHPKYTETPSPPGDFPAQMIPTKSGGTSLRDSVSSWGPSGWSAWTAPGVFYAGIQEYGDSMTAKSPFKPMTWFNEGRWWSKYHVKVPARPYMRPTVVEEIASGDLTAVAMAAFEIAVWG